MNGVKAATGRPFSSLSLPAQVDRPSGPLTCREPRHPKVKVLPTRNPRVVGTNFSPVIQTINEPSINERGTCGVHHWRQRKITAAWAACVRLRTTTSRFACRGACAVRTSAAGCTLQMEGALSVWRLPRGLEHRTSHVPLQLWHALARTDNWPVLPSALLHVQRRQAPAHCFRGAEEQQQLQPQHSIKALRHRSGVGPRASVEKPRSNRHVNG